MVLVVVGMKSAATTEPIMAKKKPVSKKMYHILNIGYHMICLSGLIWQVTKISVDFFKYEVLKDISVIMPEELEVANRADRVTYFCLWNSDVLVIEKYASLFQKKVRLDPELRRFVGSEYLDLQKYQVLQRFTIEERFDITLDIIGMKRKKKIQNFQEFMVGDKYCFEAASESYITLPATSLINVTNIRIARGQPLPLFDYRRLDMLKVEYSSNFSSTYETISYQYSMEKLKWPYNDLCINYQEKGYLNQLNAIVDCLDSRINITNTISQYHFVMKNDIRYYNRSIDYVIRRPDSELWRSHFGFCNSLHRDPDCKEIVHLTESRLAESKPDHKPKVYLRPGTDKNPSFTRVSKPRIGTIDYVTYVLGALGAWIGFSFIAINPVPYFLSISRDAKTNTFMPRMMCGMLRKIVRLEDEVKKLTEEKIVRLESELVEEKMKSESAAKKSESAHKKLESMIRQLCQDVHRLKQGLNARR